MPEPKHGVEDCPVDVRNRAEGYVPLVRLSIWYKEDGTKDARLHLCGVKDSGEIAQMIRFLSQELCEMLGESDPDDDENSADAK